jgi:hypothetical protein
MGMDGAIETCSGSPSTCQEIASQQPTNYMPGVSSPAPAGFPAPPTGAVFCGSFSNTTPEVGAVYLSGTLSQSDIFEYYASALMAQGFSIPAPTTLAACVAGETFMMISGGPFCGGGIEWNGVEHYFRVTYAEYCGSCEANGASCADDIDCCTDRCVGVANGVTGVCG